MTEQEKTTLIEAEQRSKSNSHRIDDLEADMKELQKEQKAIYQIASSVEVIAHRVGTIEDKVDDTNAQVSKLSEKVNDAENKPYQQVAKNVNSVRIAIITAVCTLIATGIISAILNFGG